MTDLMQELKDLYCTLFQKRSIAATTDVVWQCILNTGENYYLNVINGQFEFGEDQHASPTLTLYFTNAKIPMQIASAELNPMTAFLNNDFRSDSHLLLVMYYLMLFGPLAADVDLR